MQGMRAREPAGGQGMEWAGGRAGGGSAGGRRMRPAGGQPTACRRPARPAGRLPTTPPASTHTLCQLSSRVSWLQAPARRRSARTRGAAYWATTCWAGARAACLAWRAAATPRPSGSARWEGPEAGGGGGAGAAPWCIPAKAIGLGKAGMEHSARTRGGVLTSARPALDRTRRSGSRTSTRPSGTARSWRMCLLTRRGVPRCAAPGVTCVGGKCSPCGGRVGGGLRRRAGGRVPGALRGATPALVTDPSLALPAARAAGRWTGMPRSSPRTVSWAGGVRRGGRGARRQPQPDQPPPRHHPRSPRLPTAPCSAPSPDP